MKTDSKDFENTVVPYDIVFSYTDEKGKEHVWYYDRASMKELEQLLALEDAGSRQAARRQLLRESWKQGMKRSGLTRAISKRHGISDGSVLQQHLSAGPDTGTEKRAAGGHRIGSGTAGYGADVFPEGRDMGNSDVFPERRIRL